MLNDSIKLKNAGSSPVSTETQVNDKNAQKNTTVKIVAPGTATNEKSNSRF